MQDDRPLIALVTGASRGIGGGIATQLAARGIRVAVHYHRNDGAARAILQGLSGCGHEVFGGDLADAAATENLFRRVADTLGPVDILINNAGVFFDHPPLRTDYEHWQAAWRTTLDTNLIGPANLSLLAVQAMAARQPRGHFGRGRIVNVSSRGAFRGEPEGPAYGASKAGLNAMSQSLAKALAPSEIYVYSVAPGWVETDMALGHLNGPQGGSILDQHPLGRLNRIDEVAAAVVYCALDAPPAMTGGIIDVNGASYLRS